MVARGRSALGAYSAVLDFFRKDIWVLRREGMPWWRAASIRLLQICTVTIRKFVSDQCSLHASALTFYTILSIVPVFAVIFGIAKGFSLDKMLEKELMEQLAGQEEVLERILSFSRNLLQNTQGGLIAGVGVVVMFWSAIKVLGQVESSLNVMWGVAKLRPWSRRFSDYLAIMLIAPVLFLVAGSASVFVQTQFTAMAARFEIIGMMGPLLHHALNLTPFILVWVLFTLIYMVMPNTRVSFGAAVIGAAVGGILYQLVQWFYIGLQVGVSKENAIYGSFAALPLFLAWVQTSWTIVLLGAELSYSVQHSESSCGAGSFTATPAEQKLIGLHILKQAIQRFLNAAPPMTASELAIATGIPLGLIQKTASDLVGAGLLSSTASREPNQQAFQPAMDVRLLTLQRVSEAIESAGGSPGLLDRVSNPDAAVLKDAFQKLSQVAAESPANRMVSDL